MYSKAIKLFITSFIICLTSASLSASATSTELAKLYPGWVKKNVIKDLSALNRIHDFILKYKDQSKIAVFDFDGTLYNQDVQVHEKFGARDANKNKAMIKAGQPVWHIWAANNYNKKALKGLNLFPLYRNDSQFVDPQTGCEGDACPLFDLILKDDYLEHKTNQDPKGFHKFGQIATLEAGMTPLSMAKGLSIFLNDYPVRRHAMTAVLDVLQNMLNNGFKVWVVSGSNPHLIAATLKKIQDEMTEFNYDFGDLAKVPYQPSSKDGSSIHSRIIGNFAKVVNGKFSAAYDDRYIPFSKYGQIYANMKYGKRLAVRNFIEEFDGPEKGMRGEAVFCAGNSGGDLEMMYEVLDKNKLRESSALGLTVNASSGLKKELVDKKDPRVVSIKIKLSH
jgi:hypothetical protein